jgi:hypothetical protein
MTVGSDEYASPPQRLALWRIALVALVAGIGVLYILAAFSGLQNALPRAVFPFADNQPGEWPLIEELHRFALGQPTYTPTTLLSAHSVGAAYPFVLGVLRKLSLQGDQIVAYRFISMLLGFLAIVPLSFAALAILERAGFQRTIGVTVGVVVSTAALTVAILSRTATFDSLDPGNLEYLLVATALALHFTLAGGRAPTYLVWVLVADGVACGFVKQSAVFVAPILLAGLVVARVVTPRVFAGAIGACVGGLIVGLLIMPGDARAWTLLVPLAQPYVVSTARAVQAWQFFTHWAPYNGMSFLSAAPAFYLLWKRRGTDGLAVDIAAVATVILVGLFAYFKQFGSWDDLTVISAATIPYTTAWLGIILEPRTYPRQQTLMAASALLPIALATSLFVGVKQVPDIALFSEMDAARIMARNLCAATSGKVVVTILPELFDGCRSVQFALGPSYDELVAAYPRYFVGPTVYDRPTDAEYIVVSSGFAIPWQWRAHYHHVVRRVPVVVGLAANYFPFEMLVIERS